MKNYALSETEKKNFIEYYQVHDNALIVKFGNNKRYKIEYSKEREEMLLHQMEQQIFNLKEKKETFQALQNVSLMGMNVTLALSLVASVIMFANNNIPPLNEIYAVSSAILGSIIFGTIAIKDSFILRDINKHNYYITNKAVFDMQKNEEKTNNKVINVNDIDEMSLRDLKILKFNIFMDTLLKDNNKYTDNDKYTENKKLVRKYK